MSIVLVVLGVVLVVGYLWYVSIIKRRNAMQEAFSGIDVQLKKRADLIPNILKIAAKFMAHERELLEEVTRLRSEVLQAADANADQETRFALEQQLESKMGSLLVSVENYPELKSQENMLAAQHAYADVEEHISAARRSYNAANRGLRDSIQVFPGNIIASIAGVTAMPFFEASSADRAPVDANQYLG